MIKIFQQFGKNSIGVCCYMVTGHIECFIVIEVHNISYEDMTGKRGENVTG